MSAFLRSFETVITDISVCHAELAIFRMTAEEWAQVAAGPAMQAASRRLARKLRLCMDRTKPEAGNIYDGLSEAGLLHCGFSVVNAIRDSTKFLSHGARKQHGVDMDKTTYFKRSMSEPMVVAAITSLKRDAMLLSAAARADPHWLHELALKHFARDVPAMLSACEELETQVNDAVVDGVPIPSMNQLASKLAASGFTLPAGAEALGGTAVQADETLTKWADAVAKDLAAKRGKAVIIVGERQPAWVHGLAHLMNVALDGHTKTFSIQPDAGMVQTQNSEKLAEALNKG